MPELTVFTCADRGYEDFAPLFIASALWSNPAAHVEIGLEQPAAFRRTPAHAALEAHHAGRFTVAGAQWKNAEGRRNKANTVRFVTRPQVQADHVYISDIDIITLEPDILARHTAYMARTKLPYSNWVRTDTNRLTGLHFARWDFQYPLPAHDDLLADPSRNDEEVLFELVRRKLGCDPPRLDLFRPVHGIHISPNRRAGGGMKDGRAIPGWGIGPHVAAWRAFRATAEFQAIEPTLSERVAGCIAQIDALAAPKSSPVRKAPLAIADADRETWAKAGITLERSITRLAPAAAFEPPCTVAGNIGPGFTVAVGAFTYMQGGLFTRVRLGRYCSIAPGVAIGVARHPSDWLSSSPFQYRADFRRWGSWASAAHGVEDPGWTTIPFSTVPGETTIGNDVWIGQNVVVLPGVTIGDGAIIGANAVVTRDVEPYAIVAGIPARLVRRRFPDATIARLLALRWWRFAPWQLKDVPFAAIDQAIDAIDTLDRAEAPEWQPGWITPSTLAGRRP